MPSLRLSSLSRRPSRAHSRASASSAGSAAPSYHTDVPRGHTIIGRSNMDPDEPYSSAPDPRIFGGPGAERARAYLGGVDEWPACYENRRFAGASTPNLRRSGGSRTSGSSRESWTPSLPGYSEPQASWTPSLPGYDDAQSTTVPRVIVTSPTPAGSVANEDLDPALAAVVASGIETDEDGWPVYDSALWDSAHAMDGIAEENDAELARALAHGSDEDWEPYNPADWEPYNAAEWEATEHDGAESPRSRAGPSGSRPVPDAHDRDQQDSPPLPHEAREPRHHRSEPALRHAQAGWYRAPSKPNPMTRAFNALIKNAKHAFHSGLSVHPGDGPSHLRRGAPPAAFSGPPGRYRAYPRSEASLSPDDSLSVAGAARAMAHTIVMMGQTGSRDDRQRARGPPPPGTPGAPQDPYSYPGHEESPYGPPSGGAMPRGPPPGYPPSFGSRGPPPGPPSYHTRAPPQDPRMYAAQGPPPSMHGYPAPGPAPGGDPRQWYANAAPEQYAQYAQPPAPPAAPSYASRPAPSHARSAHSYAPPAAPSPPPSPAEEENPYFPAYTRLRPPTPESAPAPAPRPWLSAAQDRAYNAIPEGSRPSRTLYGIMSEEGTMDGAQYTGRWGTADISDGVRWTGPPSGGQAPVPLWEPVDLPMWRAPGDHDQ